METKLTRIAEIAKERPNERITALAFLINKESITESHQKMKTGKATGVDEITKETSMCHVVRPRNGVSYSGCEAHRVRLTNHP